MISVIMSVYNESENYLRLSIESILAQTIENFEYIIVLDNPENKIAKSVLNEYAIKDKRIKLLFNKKNLGLTRSLNKALEYAEGEFIARMDADDISEKDRFEKEYQYLCVNKLDIVGCSLRRISETGNIINKHTNPSYSPACIKKLLKYDDCVAHPSWFAKRNVYDKLMGYREISCCEDYDFLLRAIHENFRIGICGEVLLNYRINTRGISRTNGLRQMLSANYLAKNEVRINDISQFEIDQYLKSKLTSKSETSYEKSITLLNKIIDDVKNKKFTSIVKLPIVILNSKYSLINIKKILRMQIIKRKNK